MGSGLGTLRSCAWRNHASAAAGGGVIAPSYRLFPKYDGGIFRFGKSLMLLGRGLGSHTLPFRFFNPAELYEVILKPIE